MQTVLPLSNNTAVKLTTARYYTPNGRSIQAKGIVPDVTVEETAAGDSHERIREADLERHLDNDKEKLPATKDADKASAKTIPKNGKNKGAPKDEDEDAPKSPPFEFASKSDYQLSQAMNLLKAWQVIQRR